MRLTVASYNTHAGVGVDRRFDVARIAAVIGELHADVIALQELQLDGRANMLDVLRDRTGFYAVAQRTYDNRHGGFGNGLLSRFPIAHSALHDLSVPHREPRGALDARLDCDGALLRIVVTHLGLRPAERLAQVRRLVAVLKRDATPTVLAGDFNEWRMPHRALHALREHLVSEMAPATFPSFAPLFALDRLGASSPAMLRHVRAHRSALARRASDHLPLLAELDVMPG